MRVQWKGHSGQNAVYAQGFADRIAVDLQLCGNAGRFDGLENVDAQPVQTQGSGKGEHLPGQGGKLLFPGGQRLGRRKPFAP